MENRFFFFRCGVWQISFQNLVSLGSMSRNHSNFYSVFFYTEFWIDKTNCEWNWIIQSHSILHCVQYCALIIWSIHFNTDQQIENNRIIKNSVCNDNNFMSTFRSLFHFVSWFEWTDKWILTMFIVWCTSDKNSKNFI